MILGLVLRATLITCYGDTVLELGDELNMMARRLAVLGGLLRVITYHLCCLIL